RGLVAVARGGSTPTKNSAIPSAATPRTQRSRRCTGSRSSQGPRTRMQSGLASSRNTALAAVVSLFAWTNRMVVTAYAPPPRSPPGKFDATISAGARNVRSIDAPAARPRGGARARRLRPRRRPGGPRAGPRPLERRRDDGGAGQGRHLFHLVRGAACAATRL